MNNYATIQLHSSHAHFKQNIRNRSLELVGFLRLPSRNQFNNYVFEGLYTSRQKESGLKTAKQDEVQTECRILFLIIDEKNLFQRGA